MSQFHKQSTSQPENAKPQRKPKSAVIGSRSNKLKSNIIVDLKRTQYKLIRQVVQKELTWRIIKKQSEQHADIIWTDCYVSEEEINDLLPYQKINHFPGSYQLGNKHFLAKNINKMKRQFPDEYKFFPETWLLPDDFELFRNQKEKYNSEAWILKPADSCQGKGIMISNDIEAIEQKIRGSKRHFVLQNYIKNPYLLNSLKFDFRVYVLVLSLKPLEVYIYKEGLARLATSHYKKPHKNNIGNTFMHLTNYAINKKNPLFNNQEEGHKRKFSSVLELLKEQGVNIDSLMEKISKAIVNTIISAQPYLSHLYASTAPNRIEARNCFQILGFDILLDDKLEPYIMEVNHTPSFRASSQTDRQIKYNLIKDTLLQVNRCKPSKVLQATNFQWDIKANYQYKLIYPLESSKQYHEKILQRAQLIFDLWTGVVKKTNTSTTGSQITEPNKKLIARKSVNHIESKGVSDYSLISQDATRRKRSQRNAELSFAQSPSFMVSKLYSQMHGKTQRYSNKDVIQKDLSKIDIQQNYPADQEKKSSSVFISKYEKIDSMNTAFRRGNLQYALAQMQLKKSPLKMITFKPPKTSEIRVLKRMNNNIIKRVKYA